MYLNNFSDGCGTEMTKARFIKFFTGGIPGIPYIIFGPPGTGKTVTITEAIKQIWKSNNRANIVAAAPSNSAADLLARRLIENVPKTQILR